MIVDDLFEAPQPCPECGGVSFSNLILAEKKDACYYKVKASAKVWPSAYASGRLVQCRKKGAGNYGNKSEGVMEMDQSQTPPGRDGSTDPDASKKEYTAKATTAKKVAKHGEKILNKVLNKKKGVAEATGDQKFDSMMSRMTAEPKYPDREMPPTSIPELIQWADQNNKPYHKFFAQWAQKHRFTNVNDALVWVGDNVDPYDEFGPKDHENDFGDIVGEPLIDAAKHNPKAAELLKVFKCYEEIIDDWDDEYRQMNLPENQLDEKSVSQAQFRTMAAAAHNPKFARKVGIKQSVAKEFNQADKGQDYKKLPDRTTEGAPVTTTPGSINPGGAVDNFKQQMANNTEVAYQKKLSGVGEGEQQKGADYRDPPEADYGDDYQDMVARMKKLAGLGPLKTVYDPVKRVYRNMPTAVQPKR